MAANTVDMSYNVGGSWWGSVAWKVLEDDSKEAHNLMIGGNVKITKTGEIKTKNYTDGTSDIVCDYKIEVVFYNQTYVPYVAVYEGEIILIDQSQDPEYETYLYLLYYGGNKWCIMHGVEEEDYVAVFYVYAAEDNTFEKGLSEGKYIVAEDPSPWDLLPSGDPFTIAPGEIINGNKLAAGHQSAVWNWELTGFYDAITNGSMEVANRGDGYYKIDLKLYGGLGYVDFTTTFEGMVDVINDNSPKASAPALEVLKAKTTSKKGYKKDTSFEFRGPVLGR